MRHVRIITTGRTSQGNVVVGGRASAPGLRLTTMPGKLSFVLLLVLPLAEAFSGTKDYAPLFA
eukprot:1660884-Prymnesium_polylepis.1